MKKRVAVIGAGLSGSICANRLSKCPNFTVNVFEKSRGCGGRMSTRRGTRPDGKKFHCDHGAQYFTARSEEFRVQVEEWQKAGVVDIWKVKPYVYDNRGWHESASELNRWCGTPSMNEPVKYLLKEESAHFNTTINKVEKSQTGRWILHSMEHGQHDKEFDVVVFSVPSPQASPLVAPHSSKLAAIADKAEMKGAWAVMLHFQAPIEAKFDSAFVNIGPLSWISRNNSKPSRNSETETWILHATSQWSEANMDADGNQVAADLITAFCSLSHTPAFSDPFAWSAHKWKYATTHPNLDIGHAWDENELLGLCGDWLNVGKVEGAWMSGNQLAHTIEKQFEHSSGQSKL